MKKLCFAAAVLLLLTGCGAQQAMETVTDDYLQPVSAEAWQMIVDVPVDASVQVLQSDDAAKLYLCDGYTVTVQTMGAGDLEKTLRTVTGYSKEELDLLQTHQENIKRYECVFTAAGEGETQVGRACVLDDGNYHYAVTVLAGESVAGELAETWKMLFDSIRLVGPEADLNSGS